MHNSDRLISQLKNAYHTTDNLKMLQYIHKPYLFTDFLNNKLYNEHSHFVIKFSNKCYKVLACIFRSIFHQTIALLVKIILLTSN